MSANDIVRTTVMVDIIARRDDLDALLEHGSSLEDVVYFITEGAGIGTMGYGVGEIETLDGPTGPDTVAALVAVGNDGTYFEWMEEPDYLESLLDNNQEGV